MPEQVIHVVVNHKVYHLTLFGLPRHWLSSCLELPQAKGQGVSIDAARDAAVASIEGLLARQKEVSNA